MFYGVDDQWVPIERYERMKEVNTKGEVVLCEKGISHAFVTAHSSDMARLVAKALKREFEATTMELSARLFLGVLLALISQVLARGAPVGAKTHLLDEHNFETTTRSGTWIVKHYSPSCGHCLHFQPKWDAVVAARSVELFEKDVHFGEIDCLENMQLCQLNKVESWPRVLVFTDSKVVDSLNGDRTEQELRDFIDKALTPGDAAAVVQQRKYTDNSVILDATNFTQATEQGIWLVKLYSPTCPHCRAMAPDWTKMTDELADQ
ncbi:hypothetical protein LPJ53_006628, partial [Coemansia erecta]